MTDAPSRHPLPVELERLLHDLRGALNAVRMHLEILKRGGAEETQSASLATIEQELSRLAIQLPAAFAVAAVERGELERVNLRVVIEGALREHGLGPVTIAEAPWPDLRADARLLALAVAHLARNALTATRAAGGERPAPRLSCVTSADGAITLVVRDWGRGLSSTNPRSLIRLAPTDDRRRMGIGLLVVERVARLHGGRLEFGAPPDGGAEVRLTLPLK
jgi:signal transduction histidine kinase